MDVYAIQDKSRCPVTIIMTYLSLLPKEMKCKSFYLQPVKKYCEGKWYRDRPVGVN